MSIPLEHVTWRYDGHPVVNDVSLDIADAECFVLLGPSGRGRSTLLGMIAGLIPSEGGRVLLRGRNMTHAAPQKRVSLVMVTGVGYALRAPPR
jgi:ABC-type sugar transport system ATPase subunit